MTKKKIALIAGAAILVVAVLIGILIDANTTTVSEFSEEMTKGFESFQEKVDESEGLPGF